VVGGAVILNAIFLDFYQINGAVLDAIEHFLYARRVGKEVQLVVLTDRRRKSNDIQTIFDIIRDRYVLDKSDEEFVVSYDDCSYVRQRYKTVLILDCGTADIASTISCEKLVMFHDHSQKLRCQEAYHSMRRFPHVKIYHDPRVSVLRGHPRNFFSLFSEYVYVHDNLYFDPRPRMFHECLFYGKKITYVNDETVKDGGWIRWNEIQRDGKDALSLRNMTEDYILMKELA
jgi:hypothetical protein